VLSAILFLIARRATAHGSFETSSRGRVTRPRKQLSRARRTLVHLLITFILCISLLPHLGVLLISCADSWFMTVLPDRYTAEHYVAVFQHPLTVVSLRNSIMLALLSTGLDIVLGFTVAFLVLRTSIPGRSVLDAFSVMPLAIPGIIIALGYISAFSGTFLDNRINPFPLLVAAYAVRRLPYMVRSCVAGFQQGSIVLEEAARSVGAPPALVFRRVTLPLMSAHVMSGAILCFAFAMLEVSDSLFLALEERYYPVSKALYALSGRPDGVAIAAALGVVVTSLITACIYAAGKLSGRSIDEVFRA
jgi:iron(III) transport system permease protein